MDDDYLDLYLDYSEMLQEAQDENAKLREQVADACMQLGGAWVRCSELRELVRHLYECMCNVDADGNYECDSCEYDNAEGKCDFERLMRELGVGVPA